MASAALLQGAEMATDTKAITAAIATDSKNSSAPEYLYYARET